MEIVGKRFYTQQHGECIIKRRLSVEKHSVNPGDIKAICHIVKTLKPNRVLEIGTYKGSSTAAIAAQLPENASMITVDIEAYPEAKEKFMDFPIKFIQKKSHDYLEDIKETEDKFDFIFIDGNHEFENVYLDLLYSLLLLESNGTILMHDYFPEGKPLWPDGKIISGPYRAVKRIKEWMQEERITVPDFVDIEVTPLGELPWPTKQGTHTTSLALVRKILNEKTTEFHIRS